MGGATKYGTVWCDGQGSPRPGLGCQHELTPLLLTSRGCHSFLVFPPDSNKSNCMSALTSTLPLGLHSHHELFIGSSRTCLRTPTGVGEWNVLHVGEGAALVESLSQCGLCDRKASQIRLKAGPGCSKEGPRSFIPPSLLPFISQRRQLLPNPLFPSLSLRNLSSCFRQAWWNHLSFPL